MKRTDNDRRDFLKTSAAVAGSVAVLGLSESCTRQKDSEMVQILDQDGNIIEVRRDQVEETIKDDIRVREGMKNRKFVMVIDLARCANARKCVSACNKMHSASTPNDWLKVLKMSDSEKTAPYWQPMLCQHCDKPPCVKVCPVDATFKRRDGIVLVDNDRCIGCRFCMAACPYSARVFNWEEPSAVADVEHALESPETSWPPQKGTVGKCDFCPDVVEKGELPHCVTACPNSVFFFGDLYEDTVTNGSETFRFSKLIKDRAAYREMESYGTHPSVYYLPPSNRLYDFEEGLENYSEFKQDSLENTEQP